MQARLPRSLHRAVARTGECIGPAKWTDNVQFIKVPVWGILWRSKKCRQSRQRPWHDAKRKKVDQVWLRRDSSRERVITRKDVNYTNRF